MIIEDDENTVTVFKITSKYKTKSANIRKYYYPIKDWQDSGLFKQSYVDTINRLNLLKNDVKFKYVGKLSFRDKTDLSKFIEGR